MSEQPSTNPDPGASTDAPETSGTEEHAQQTPAERHSAEWGEQDS